MSENIDQSYLDCINTWNEQWKKACDEMIKYPKEVIPQLEEIAADQQWASVLMQSIGNNAPRITVSPSSISRLFRGVKLGDEESDPDESRFIPTPEYAGLNRMNGPDKIYFYFTVNLKPTGGDDVVCTSACELRVGEKDRFWGCDFEIPEKFKGIKIINVAAEKEIPKNDADYMNFLRQNVSCRIFLKNGRLEVEPNIEELEYWMLQTLFRLWEKSDMFAPVNVNDEDEQWYKYRPFHVISDYFERNGYQGIIYRSTVFKPGLCLALFDTKYAECLFDTAKQFNIRGRAKRKG